MPKEVDHDRRRHDLADAACRVIAREGVEGASLRLVAAEAGWSISSMRYYFATRTEMLIFSLWHIGNRVDARIRRTVTVGSALERLRSAMIELLPMDDPRREEALVWLAFAARSGVDVELSPAAEDVWSQLNDAIRAHLNAAIAAGELPQHLNSALEATRLHALIDGLSVQLVSAPGHASPELAASVIDEHIASLRFSRNLE